MPDPSATVTLPGLEIVKVGKWAASTGPVEVTAEDIADAVAASKDPEIDKGPLKFGHTGALSDLGDSTPAFGWLDNLSIADDGVTVVGDLTDVPAALAPAIKAAFKRRSAELAWGVKTVGGKTYRMVIDGLALLGVQPPAVKGMADLAALYDPAAPPVALATSKLAAESHSTLSLYDVAPDAPTAGQQMADAIRWAKKAAADVAACVGNVAGLQGAFDALDAMVPADSRGLLGAAPHAVPDRTTPDGGTMPKYKPETIKKLRSLLSDVTDDTPDEDVEAKAEEAGVAPDAETEPKPDADANAGDDTGDEEKPAAELAAAMAAAKAAGLVMVPAALLEQVGEQAKAGAEARSLLAAQARDAILDQAQAAGKLGAGETLTKVRAQLSAQLDKDPEGAKALIEALPQIVPVGELGHDGHGPDTAHLAAEANAAWDSFIVEHFGDEIPAKEA